MRRFFLLLAIILVITLSLSACIPTTHHPPMPLANYAGRQSDRLSPGSLDIDSTGTIHVLRPQCLPPPLGVPDAPDPDCALYYETYALGHLLSTVEIPSQGHHLTAPKVAVDGADNVHLIWQDCEYSTGNPVCKLYYWNPASGDLAMSVGSEDSVIDSPVLVTNEVPVFDGFSTLATYFAHTARTAAGDRPVYCAVQPDSTNPFTCAPLTSQFVDPGNVFSLKLAVARDGTLGAGWVQTGTTAVAHLAVIEKGKTPVSFSMVSTDGQPYPLEVTFAYRDTGWDFVGLTRLTPQTPTGSVEGLYYTHCRQGSDSCAPATSLTPLNIGVFPITLLRNYTMVAEPISMPATANGAYFDVFLTEVPGASPNPDPNVSYLFFAFCETGMPECPGVMPVERPPYPGMTDADPYGFIINVNPAVVWQMSGSVATQPGDLLLTLPFMNDVYVITRPQGGPASTAKAGLVYDVAQRGTTIAAMWEETNGDGVEENWLVFNLQQTHLPVTLR